MSNPDTFVASTLDSKGSCRALESLVRQSQGGSHLLPFLLGKQSWQKGRVFFSGAEFGVTLHTPGWQEAAVTSSPLPLIGWSSDSKTSKICPQLEIP